MSFRACESGHDLSTNIVTVLSCAHRSNARERAENAPFCGAFFGSAISKRPPASGPVALVHPHRVNVLPATQAFSG